ncbi:hypothetical protein METBISCDRAFT_22559 [Metschnikowia bicuspidata]|uniref:Pre-mRNA-splicing factor SYF2 n=1 Tax=Metschnikowia bicuspidata TaxID=27322 RepID=A0A4P9ZEK6_9ASCO|nr:hypothetical protein METBISCDRAFT_22559 [Metschnikowia bicuspidata]
MNELEVESRISELKRLKVLAQRACHHEAAKPPPPSITADEKETDSLDWTAEGWIEKEPFRVAKSNLGYRNLSELAEATYKKELSKLTLDQDKYLKSMQASSMQPPYSIVLAPEDIEAVAQGLREASERRQKRRRVGDGGLYMNDRNRQFNLKLNREFGKSVD